MSSPRSPRNGSPAPGAARPTSAKLPAERPADRGIPEATVARLPVYLRALVALADRGIETCSSEELATAAGVNSAKLRKDLSYLGSYGTRGVGYDVEYLRYQIAREIGVTQDWPVLVARHDIAIGVIATPADAAQQVCDRLVAAGVTSILNFAPTVLTVPDGVDVRKVDLSIELQILAYHEQRKALALGDAAVDAVDPVDMGSVGTDGRAVAQKAVGA